MSLSHSSLISKKGFTLVELIIGMTIFSIGMTGVLALLGNTISASFISRHEIVVANLQREELELVKNIRNTNIRSFVDWDRARIEDEFTGQEYFTGGVFTVENDFSSSGVAFGGSGNITESPVMMQKISFTSPNPTLEERFTTSRLFIDIQGRYTHVSTGSGTNYASYIVISPLKFDANGNTIEPKNPQLPTGNGRNQGYIIDAYVIVKSQGYREYDMRTVITDWKK